MEATSSDQLLKRRPKSREVSSRFLSPVTIDTGTPSLNQTISPVGRPKAAGATPGPQKHRSLENSGFIRGLLWPTTSSQSSKNSNKNNSGDRHGNQRLKDLLNDDQSDDKWTTSNNAVSLNRQRSCTEFGRFENVEKESAAKENHRPIFGGSMRYTGKFRFPGKSSSSSNSSSSSSKSSSSHPSEPRDHTSSRLVHGRLSVDENALNNKSYHPKPNAFTDTFYSESEGSDVCSGTDFGSPAIGKTSSSISSPATYMSSTVSSRKYGVEVSSKYMHSSIKSRRSSDSNIPNAVSSELSPRSNRLMVKDTIKRANSLTSQWAQSPGRPNSPPTNSIEIKGRSMPSFSTLKPPTSPSKTKGVEKLLNMGLDLFKSKKSSSSSSSLSPRGSSATVETVHELRLLHNRLIQWRYANARTNAANENVASQTERNLIYARDSLTKLQNSVVQKKLQLQKEKLEMKLNFIVHSQIKSLEAWGDMERQHLSAVSKTKDSLHSVVCRVPLIEGAQMNPQSASIAFRHASDLTASIKSVLTSFSPSAEKTVSLLSELAEVVAEENAILEECHELFRIISTLEIQEQSLKSNIIQLKLCQQQQQDQQGISL